MKGSKYSSVVTIMVVGLLEFVTGDVGALCKEETSSKRYTNQ